MVKVLHEDGQKIVEILIKVLIVAAFQHITEEMVSSAVDSFVKRLNLIVVANGGYRKKHYCFREKKLF